jgi:hypothetical protein
LELKVNGSRVLRLEDNGDSLIDSDSTPDGAPNVIGGSPGNLVAAGVAGAVIAGGGATNYDGVTGINAVLGDYGVVGGGLKNQIAQGTVGSTIAGGMLNTNFTGGVHNDNTFNPGGGTVLMILTSGGLTVNGSFVSASDRNEKENFAPVQPLEVLEKVVALPLSSWNYKADPATRHFGPMAQDFYAAFNVGPDDKHIATVDADGVALAAIQALNQKLNEKAMEVRELKARLERLENLMTQKNGGAK